MTYEYKFLIFLVLAFAVIAISLYSKLMREKDGKKALIKENRILHADNALFEAEQLKFQLQPHTLNNMLANLKLISGKLNRGMNAFSSTLDYVLYKGNTHFVTLQDEIDFIEKYLALNDLFISEIDAIRLDLKNVDRKSTQFTSKCIPHLITAYFIENAFKHGDVHHPEFLRINLSLTDDAFEMTVINRNRPMPKSLEVNRGVGLKNMKKRLDLLLRDRYEVSNTCNEHQYFSNLTIRF